jgi:wobble nucleotide-excising tRNase
MQWVHGGSHDIYDDISISTYSDAGNTYRKVFKEIFTKSNNEAHYNMMMGIEESKPKQE